MRDVRDRGLLVISLNMAGSVPDAAHLVVTDPVQAGVMTVMAVAETAKFSLARLKRRVLACRDQFVARVPEAIADDDGSHARPDFADGEIARR